MTYKEFEKWCKENGYEYIDDGGQLLIESNALRYARVDKTKAFRLSVFWDAPNQKELFDKVVELAGTPIQEREEPKRYIVKITSGIPEGFYALHKSGGNLYMHNDNDPDLTSHYKLTEEQIKAIDPRFMAFAVEVLE